jgi:signal transduction histidine kinase
VRDAKKGFQADGFPLKFRILAGTPADTNGWLIASFTAKDGLLPRIAPLVVPCPGTTASWVRIETDQLSPRVIDDQFGLQLAELLVFSGQKNCALRRPVTCPGPDLAPISAWGSRFLTDGSVPYLMDAASGDKGVAFMSSVGAADQPSLTIDLKEIHSISQINLHAIDQSDTVPQAFFGDFGIPKHLQMEGATRADFSDSTLLLDARCETAYDISPIMSWNVPATPCRYVRLTALDPYIYNDGRFKGTRIGFAEIELLAHGHNVALNKPITNNFKEQARERALSSLTDGLNFYGQILPAREWLQQLARRHDLENQHPLIAKELSNRYTRQKNNLRRMYWLAALLGAGIGFTILIERFIRLKQITSIKERFAADLHDELGANMHTIGWIGELIERKAKDLPEEIMQLLHRIRAVSKQSGIAVRHFINMQDAEEIYTGLKADMQRAAKRIAVELEHDIAFEGEDLLSHLDPRIRIDLFLFYKESLINVCRHAGATRLSTRLTATPKNISLVITDNGCGMADAIKNGIPPSLKRRARLIGAHVTVECPPTGGTGIHLTLRTPFNLRRLAAKQ